MNDIALTQCLALTFIPGIGDVNIKRLIAYCGGIEPIFSEKRQTLLKIPGIGVHLSSIITNQTLIKSAFKRAETELEYIKKKKISVLFYLEKEYPKRLLNCNDGPILLYFKGEADLNKQKIISIVGTRRVTDYGRNCCEKLVNDLVKHEVLVVSGLALGIDSIAHRTAIECGLSTIGVLGHGLDRIYPESNKTIAMKMLKNGGLITEFPKETNPDRENFPKRNRIIAGMADATIVVEAGITGGALITADIANSYNRDVFAFPGRINDTFSMGCNNLIKTNRAALIESVKDLEYILGWELELKARKPVQKKLFVELSDDERKIVEVLYENKSMQLDEIGYKINLNISRISACLLNLEFNGLVKSLPGKIFEII